MIKKAVSLLLIVLLSLTFTACGDDAGQETSAPVGEIDAALVGTWTAEHDTTMVFNADGTGFVDSDAITWSVSGDTLTIQCPGHPGMTCTYAVSISSLALSFGDDVTIYTRQTDGITSITP